MSTLLNRITQLFPLWALLLSGIGYAQPTTFVAMQPAIVPLLAAIMFAMGITLKLEDFRRVIERPAIIAAGVALQYGVMPLAAFLLAHALGLPAALLIGMVLVGASAGGTASNVICYLAKGDVALSITLTLASTLLATVAMPGLTWLYIGQLVPVPVIDMLLSVVKIVVAPVLLGVAVNTVAGTALQRVKPLFPVLAVGAIVLIIAIVVALNHARIASLGPAVVLAVMLHNATGLLGGYWLARLMGYDQKVCRTLAIEVGMQNSGLSVALAVKYFSPLAALPGAIFSIWHNLSGSLLASVWSRRPASP